MIKYVFMSIFVVLVAVYYIGVISYWMKKKEEDNEKFD